MSVDPRTARARLVRRQTHASRSGPAVLVVCVLALLASWFAVELALDAAGQRQLLVEPADAAIAVAGIHELQTAWLIAGSVVAVVLAVLLLGWALGPGRLGRRAKHLEHADLVVDDTVLAGSVSGVAARSVGLPAARVRTSVGPRDVRIDVTPLSGVAVDEETIRREAESFLERCELGSRMRVTVRTATSGVVGS